MKCIRWQEFVTGLVLGALILVPWSSLLEERPYRRVEVVSVLTEGDSVTVTANFLKNECTFNRLEVFGFIFGEVEMLSWENVTIGLETDLGLQYDRTQGDQTLRIKIDTRGEAYDKIEIRTRHNPCGGKAVDRVFATIKDY